MKAKPGPGLNRHNYSVDNNVTITYFHTVKEPPTRFSHFRDGHILFVGHVAQDGEDGKACYKTGSTVQETEAQAIPAHGAAIGTSHSETRAIHPH